MHLFDNSTAIIAWAADCLLIAALLIPVYMSGRMRRVVVCWEAALVLKGLGLVATIIAIRTPGLGLAIVAFSLLLASHLFCVTALIWLDGRRIGPLILASPLLWMIGIIVLPQFTEAANFVSLNAAVFVLDLYMLSFRLSRSAKVASAYHTALDVVFAAEAVVSLVMLARFAPFSTAAAGTSLTIGAFVISSFLIFSAKIIIAVAIAMGVFEARLKRLASTDPLTGTLNRRGIVEATDHLCRDRDPEKKLAYFALDLDHFKQINDAHGHRTGDLALQHFVEVARKCLRDADVLGRSGGEEFTVLADVKDAPGALEIAERLRHAVSGSPLFLAGKEIPLSVSIGLAVSPNWPVDIDRLVTDADQALYMAKTLGRNRVVFQDSHATGAPSKTNPVVAETAG